MKRMPNISLVTSFFCLIMLFAPPARSEPVNVDDRAQSAAAASETAAIPELINLSPGWWRYLDISDSQELQNRIDLFEAKLKKIYASLPSDRKVTVLPLLTRIEVNLNALPEMKIKKTADLPIPGILAEQYTISELIGLLKSLREKRTEWKMDTIDTERLASTVKDMEQQINDLMVVYKKTPDRSPERIENGFEIAANRAALLTAWESLRIRNAKLQAINAEVLYIEKEIDHADHRLIVDEKDTSRLKQQIAVDKRRLLKARKVLVVVRQ